MKTEPPQIAITATILSLAINLSLIGAIVSPSSKPVTSPLPSTNLVSNVTPSKTKKPQAKLTIARTNETTQNKLNVNGQRIITLPTIYVYPTYSEQVALARVKQRDQRYNAGQFN